MSSTNQPHIVILGAGFAGVEAAKRLARIYRKPTDARITLIDQNNFLLFTPMLIEVLGGQVEMMHVVSATRRLSPRVDFVQGRIQSIDLAAREVTVYSGGTGFGDPSKIRVFKADQLIIALGSVPNYFGIPGLRENSVTMKDLCDAVGLRNRALALLEAANAEPDQQNKRRLLTFIVGGGGFSGVETAASMHDLIHNVSAFYPNINVNDHKIILIEALGELLPELADELSEYTRKKLIEYGTDVLVNTRITRAGRGFVELENGDRIDAGTIIWTGGISPVAVTRNLGCKHGRCGGIVCEDTCAVAGYPGVWAVGDCAEIPRHDSPKPYAPTAQNATRQGKHTADNIRLTLNGKTPKPFYYKAVGELAALGKRSGVASIYGIQLSGFTAWFLWRTVYLAKLPHLSQRIRVALDWTIDLLFGREVVEVPTQCFVAGICSGLESKEGE